MRKVRLVQMQCQPVLVADDGDTFLSMDVPPLILNAADWPVTPERWAVFMADWQEQVDRQFTDEPEVPNPGA